MKLIDIIITANHNLLRNKTRTFLTILAVFIGSFTIILSNALNTGVNDFIDKQVASIGGDGFIEIYPSAMYDTVMSSSESAGNVSEYKESTGSALSASITKDDIEKLRQVDGVTNIEIFHMLSTEWMRRVDGDKETKKYNVSVEYFPEGNFKVDLSTGKMTDHTASENQILINEKWLEPLGFSSAEEAINGTVEIAIKQTAKCYYSPDDCLATVKAKIVGVQAPGILSVSGDLHINKALDGELYRLANENVPEEAKRNYIAVGNVDPEKIDQIREKFRELKFEFITVDDMVGMIHTFLDAILVVFNIFGGIALVAASIGIVNTLFMSVQERTREIGLEKALGMSNHKIFTAFSVEAISLGFWGSAVGIVLSIILGTIANSIAKETFLSDFPTFNLVVFNPINMLIITLVIMLIAFIAGTAPARQAARKNPIDALRYE